MKKFLCIVLSLIMLVGIVGCSEEKHDGNNDGIHIKFVIDATNAYNNESLDSDIKEKINNGIILSAENLEISRDCTAGDATKLACQIHSIALDSEVSSYGLFVKGISGVENSMFGDMSYWLFRVNGETPEVGADYVTLNDGDIVEWVYTCNGGDDLVD